MAQQDSSLAASARRRLRGEESWVDISSNPSPSSVNSMASIQASRTPSERIPRPLIPMRSVTEPPRSLSTAGSSQDEYDESSSESDRVMSSSNEDIVKEDDEEVDLDDDDNRTALGVRTEEVFTPQPNAFSHPPSAHSSRDSYFPRVTSAPSSHIRPRPHLQRAREQGMTASYQPDHDAALRASLTTLLSCAAAVRPKATNGEKHDLLPQRQSLNRPSTQPTTLRLIPESALPSQSRPSATSSKSPSSPTSRPSKRRSRSRSKDREAHQSKKQRPISATYSSYDDYIISPTLAGWVISAGMVLVLSAISFSAGYAWGREVGRAEAELGFGASGSLAGSAGGANGSCAAQEAMRGSGLRRMNWAGSTSAIRA
ncbi:uncharacterized protein AB675_2464 [Cyphellophora attinorum]|uniref:Uncharacterized protein n=1 Tax=Cyphellophora attinorum TaxID=1664694 RepID=A0A0N0NRB0_9EURO|nr:uncharacterized protein AB675_2464 [Phialophora attinorum]KPI44881.1 hypothetical protein AB675_2464 [Phialophora attinorum]